MTNYTPSTGKQAPSPAVPTTTSTSPNPGKLFNSRREAFGLHLGWDISAYNNKDGSHGLYISDGITSIHCDATRTIHIKTGKDSNGAPDDGGIKLRSEQYWNETDRYRVVVGTKEDLEADTSADGKSKETNPSYSVQVYGDVDIVSEGGDISLRGKNILLNAEEEIRMEATQVIANLDDGGGVFKVQGAKLEFKGANALFDMTGSFYVDGPSEIDFNQTIKTNLDGSVAVGTPGNTLSTQSFGSQEHTCFGDESHVSLGIVQNLSSKRIDFGSEGVGRLSVGSTEDFGFGRAKISYVGAPFPNMPGTSAYEMKIGGTIGTSYNLLAGAAQTTAPVGTVDSDAAVWVSSTAALVLLN